MKKYEDIVVGSTPDDLTKYEVQEEQKIIITSHNLDENLVSKHYKNMIAALEYVKAYPQSLSQRGLNNVYLCLSKPNPKVLELSSEALSQGLGLGLRLEVSPEKLIIQLTKTILPCPKESIKVNGISIVLSVCSIFDKQDLSDFMVKLLKEKAPKLIKGACIAIKAICQEYGGQKISPIPVTKQAVENVSRGSIPIKKECMALLKVLYSYFGPILDANLGPLPSSSAKEITQFIKGRGGQIDTPKRVDTENTYDPAEDAPDILTVYTDKWCKKVLKMPKRTDKEVAIRELTVATDLPILAPGDYRHIVLFLKNILTDSMTQVMSLLIPAITISGNLSKGLGPSFRRPAKSLLIKIVPKLKDTKKQMVAVASEAIFKMTFSVLYEDILKEFLQNMTDKNPNMRQNLMILFDKMTFENNDQ